MISRDGPFMLKILKNGFASLGKQKRSPQVPALLPLLCYKAVGVSRRVSLMLLFQKLLKVSSSAR